MKGIQIPIFDSLAHPTLSETWLGAGEGNSFPSLAADLEEAGYCGACAVGLAGQDGYAHEAYITACARHPNLVAIAGYEPVASQVQTELQLIRKLGFRGIKIHPRFSGIDLDREQELLGEAFREAAKLDLVVFYCTYQHTTLERMPTMDPFLSLVSVLKMAPKARVVLVHGGDVQLLRYAELVRFNDNLLLDLSLTILKYRGSSLDNDLRFLFSWFDRRICIGTDHPEYTPSELRARFEELAGEVDPVKQENIAYRNIITFLGLEGRRDWRASAEIRRRLTGHE